MAAPTQAEENPPSEPLNYKTWVLKVSIHCEGCKKKVMRILHNIEGVYTIDIDSKIHKVTVTGSVESDALLKKLGKSGKHAELWPQKPDLKDKKSRGKSNEEDKYNAPENPKPEQGGERNEVKPGEKGKAEEAVVKSKGSPTAKNHGGTAVRNSNVLAAQVSNPGKGSVGKVQFPLDAKAEGKKPQPIPPPEKKAPEDAGGGRGETAEETSEGASSGHGSAGKKEEKKGQNGKSTEKGRVGGESAAAAAIESPPRMPVTGPIYHRPPGYYAPPPLIPTSTMNAVSYPSSSSTTSYYAAGPPYSCAYLQTAGANVEPRSPSDWAAAWRVPSDSFWMFSEENPNACSLM